MNDKKWKPIQWFECPECRGELEGFTEAEDDFFIDDDPVRCTNCGWEGRIIIVDNEAWVKEIDEYAMKKRKISGRKQKPNMAKNNGEVDTSMGKYYLEHGKVKILNNKGEIV